MQTKDPTNPDHPSHSLWQFQNRLHLLSLLSVEDLDETSLSHRLQDIGEALQALIQLARYVPRIEVWLRTNFTHTAAVFEQKTGLRTVPPSQDPPGPVPAMGWPTRGYGNGDPYTQYLDAAVYAKHTSKSGSQGPALSEAKRITETLTGARDLLHQIVPKVERFAEQMEPRACAAEELFTTAAEVQSNARDVRQKRIAELQREISELQKLD